MVNLFKLLIVNNRGTVQINCKRFKPPLKTLDAVEPAIKLNEKLLKRFKTTIKAVKIFFKPL
jgi:hypothetical protein